jgi:hypothetical protein
MNTIKITDEVRDAARRLLDRHNAAEKDRAEARYQAGLNQAEAAVEYYGRGAPNEAYIRKRADRELPADQKMRERLEAIVSGKRKLIDADWWGTVYSDVDRAKLDKIAAMADPTRNSSEHERAVASAKLASAKARRPPGSKPEPPPLPTIAAEWDAMRRARSGAKRATKTPPPQSPKLSDSVAAAQMSDSVASSAKQTSDSLKTLNERRAAKRAAARAGLMCQVCGKPLAAQRVTARFCNVTCRSQAWRRTR